MQFDRFVQCALDTHKKHFELTFIHKIDELYRLCKTKNSISLVLSRQQRTFSSVETVKYFHSAQSVTKASKKPEQNFEKIYKLTGNNLLVCSDNFHSGNFFL